MGWGHFRFVVTVGMLCQILKGGLGAWAERRWHIGPFLLSTHRFTFCQVRKCSMCNLFGLYALIPVLDLGSEVQVPQKLEKVREPLYKIEKV